MSKNEQLAHSLKEAYYNEMKDSLLVDNDEEWDEILFELSNYLGVQIVEE